jgi:hypothetical protein
MTLAPKLAVLKDRRQIGTVNVTLIEIAGGRVWTLFMVDTFNVSSALSFEKRPCEGCIANAVSRHVRVSQVRTQRT